MNKLDKNSFDVEKIRKDFPILSTQMNSKPLVYLDSSATSQKPKAMIDAISRFYETTNANVHRGVYKLSSDSTEAYEQVRKDIAEFIGSPTEQQVIFTKGTTESINLVVASWAEGHIKPGEDIVVTRMEHHSNFVPWQALAKRIGANLRIVELASDFTLDWKSFEEALSAKPKLLAITMMSNVLGVINPVAEIAEVAKRAGACVLVDGAQSMLHMPVNVDRLGVDFFAFSGHKMCGPTGTGVLWVKADRLSEMQPYQYGGDMISRVSDENTTWNEIPWKFEAGTPNFADVIGLGAAVKYLKHVGLENIEAYERELTKHALGKLETIEGLTLIGAKHPTQRGSVFSFVMANIHPHDLAQFLDHEGIAIRAGHHCAQPLLEKLGYPATSRASLCFYNTIQEIDILVDAIERAKKYFL